MTESEEDPVARNSFRTYQHKYNVYKSDRFPIPFPFQSSLPSWTNNSKALTHFYIDNQEVEETGRCFINTEEGDSAAVSCVQVDTPPMAATLPTEQKRRENEAKRTRRKRTRLVIPCPTSPGASVGPPSPAASSLCRCQGWRHRPLPTPRRRRSSRRHRRRPHR